MVSVEPAMSAFSHSEVMLALRPISTGDAAMFRRLYTTAETMRHIGRPLSAERADRVFGDVLASMERVPLARVFLAVLDAAGRAVGICALPAIDRPASRAELGIMLLPEACGRGLGFRAMTAFAGRAFELLPMRELWVQYSPAHSTMHRLAGGLGFELPDDPDGYGARTGMLVRSIRRDRWYSLNGQQQPRRL